MKYSTLALRSALALALCGNTFASTAAAAVPSTLPSTTAVRRRLKSKKGATKRKCELGKSWMSRDFLRTTASTFVSNHSLTPPHATTETKGDDKVEFECKSKTEDAETEIEDKIKFKISHDNRKGLKVKVEYEQERELQRRRLDENIEEIETETSFEVNFDRIIEYRKAGNTNSTNSDGGRRHLTAQDQAYDWGVDEIVDEMPLADWTGFTEIQQSRRRLQSGDEDTVYTFSVSTFGDIATFDFTINQAGGDNAAVTANKMKIDVRLNNYPWVGDDTYLAILSSVESEREIEIEYADDKKDKKEDDEEDKEEADENEDDESRRGRRLKKKESEEVIISFDDALAATGIRPFGEYTWAKEAEVTGSSVESLGNSTIGNNNNSSIAMMQYSGGNSTLDQEPSETIQVVATTPEDGTDRLAFSFVGSDAAHRASSIYWDPETGINYAESGASVLGYSVAIALASAAFFFTW